MLQGSLSEVKWRYSICECNKDHLVKWSEVKWRYSICECNKDQWVKWRYSIRECNKEHWVKWRYSIRECNKDHSEVKVQHLPMQQGLQWRECTASANATRITEWSEMKWRYSICQCNKDQNDVNVQHLRMQQGSLSEVKWRYSIRECNKDHWVKKWSEGTATADATRITKWSEGTVSANQTSSWMKWPSYRNRGFQNEGATFSRNLFVMYRCLETSNYTWKASRQCPQFFSQICSLSEIENKFSTVRQGNHRCKTY
jgi:hypothetical protein